MLAIISQEPCNDIEITNNNSNATGFVVVVKTSEKSNSIHKYKVCLFLAIIIGTYAVISDGNPDAKRLYDEILSGYNKLVFTLSSHLSIYSFKYSSIHLNV